jgi:acyl-CoA synthetase (AMP-forming)/AMP-acid ligase II
MEPFWRTLDQYGNRVALIDGTTQETLTYAELQRLAGRVAARLPARRSLIVLMARNDIGAVVALIAALQAGHAVWILRSGASASWLKQLVDTFRPYCVLAPTDEQLLDDVSAGVEEMVRGYVCHRVSTEPSQIHPELAIILSTSGSLGPPKGVRLSSCNFAINADQIAQSLSLEEHDRSLLFLPISYTYGLSVLNAHLSTGGSIVLEQRTVLDKRLWNSVSAHNCTLLAGVSATYDILRKVQADWFQNSTLRAVTHSGSRLSPATLIWLRDRLQYRNVDVFKMYGMTEATARMAILPPTEFAANMDAVGRPVVGGAVAIGDDGEIIYSGDNVMLGYAESALCLTEVDSCSGVLHTADIGHVDAQGLLHVSGRLDRHVKSFGYRINLDEVELYFEDLATVAATFKDDRILLHWTGALPDKIRARKDALLERLHLPPQAVELKIVHNLRRSDSGKLLRHGLVVARQPASANDGSR